MSSVKGYQALTVSTSAVSPTPPATGSTKWVMTIEGASSTAVRWRADGTAPTATVGHYSGPGKDFVFDFELARLSLIRDTAATTDAVVHFHYLTD